MSTPAPFYSASGATLLLGDSRLALRGLAAESVQCCVTSPPYWGLRDYGAEGQLGMEATPEEYVANLVEVFREVRRVLSPDGVLWLNLGDCYATGAGRVGNSPGGGQQGERWRNGHEGKHGRVGPMTQPNRMPLPGLKPKDLVGIPWRVAFALQADGWWLRSDVVWEKPNCMPESVRDRPTKAHEYVFLLTKAEAYYYDADAIREPHRSHGRGRGANALRGQAALRPRGNLLGEADYHPQGRNARSVWQIATTPSGVEHHATMPLELAHRCILTGTSKEGACPRCGVQWVQEKERQRLLGGERAQLGAFKTLGRAARVAPTTAVGVDHGRISTVVRNGSWVAACDCEAGITPATVLDPFNGSGTTGLAALALGRRYVGVELKPAYARLSVERWAKGIQRHLLLGGAP